MLQQPADANPPSRKDYAEIVEDLDAGVGRILEALSARGLAEKTLVVFVSDNGGEWLSRNAPFFHRKDTVWEGGIRVPAIFRWTAALPAGRTLSQVGHHHGSLGDVRRARRRFDRGEPASRESISCRSSAGRAAHRADALLARGRRRPGSRARCGAATGSSSSRVRSNSSST